MKRVKLSSIAQRPRYLASFPLIGDRSYPIDTFVQTEDGNYRVNKTNSIPPLAKSLQLGECYGLQDDEGTIVEVEVLLREATGAIVQCVNAEDVDVLSALKPTSIVGLTIVKLRESEFLSVPERLRFQKVLTAIALLRDRDDYDFTGKLLRSALANEDVAKRLSAASEEEALEIQNEVIIAALDGRDHAARERSARDEELSLEMLDLSRHQLEILGGLEPGALSDLPATAVQSILAMINTEEEPPIEEEGEAPKPAAKKAAAKKEPKPLPN